MLGFMTQVPSHSFRTNPVRQDQIAAYLQRYVGEHYGKHIFFNRGKDGTIILHSTPIFIDEVEALQQDLADKFGISMENQALRRDYDEQNLFSYIDLDKVNAVSCFARFAQYFKAEDIQAHIHSESYGR